MNTSFFCSVRACKEITYSMDFKKQRPDSPFFFEKEQVISLLRLIIWIFFERQYIMNTASNEYDIPYEQHYVLTTQWLEASVRKQICSVYKDSAL